MKLRNMQATMAVVAYLARRGVEALEVLLKRSCDLAIIGRTSLSLSGDVSIRFRP